MIHYHGLPMTPTVAMLSALKSRHAMVSFAHPQQIEEAAEVCQSFVLDNGAFSAWIQGKPYDFTGFEDWARHWLRHPGCDWVVIPDVIDGAEVDNHALVSDWKMPKAVSVPVYHLHESLDYLDFLAASFPRVALGSSGQYSRPGTQAWWQRIAEMMDVICDADGMPRCKLHGLRMLDPVIFSHLPLSSADSCNVARNVGIDSAWSGPYVPRSKAARAMVLIDRIEAHASARSWSRESSGVQHNLELLG